MRPLTFLLLLLLTAGPAAAQEQHTLSYLTPSSIYATPKAMRPGDVLTVVLAEQTSAQRKSGWENQSNASRGGTASVSGNSFSGTFGMDATFSRDALNQNKSVQSDLLSGTLTVVVVGIDSLTGNLMVEGKRKLEVNGESHLLQLEGLVRPTDIRHDNSILSYKIANADIEYRRGGFRRRFMRPAALTRMMAFLVLGAASVVAIL